MTAQDINAGFAQPTRKPARKPRRLSGKRILLGGRIGDLGRFPRYLAFALLGGGADLGADHRLSAHSTADVQILYLADPARLWGLGLDEPQRHRAGLVFCELGLFQQFGQSDRDL